MDFKDLSEEQKARVKACKTPEELLELAKSEGVELTDEQLSDIAAGEDKWYQCSEHNGCPADFR